MRLGAAVSPAVLFTNLTRQIEIGANCYCLDIDRRKIVLDAGLHPKREGEEAMPAFDLLPDESVDAILVSHAHQDHIGALPLLMRRQPQAPVFMTEATGFISDVMLHNSVNVMTKIREEIGTPEYPLFTHREVDLGMRRWQARPLHQRWSLHGERLGPEETRETSFELFDAGHILGSAGILIRGEGRTVFYTGDVNFQDQTISRAARFPEEPVDVLIIETTRGDSPVPEGFTRKGETQRLVDELEAAFDRGGCVLMPLFALGKTQELLAIFDDVMRDGRLSPVPIYIGGLSTKLTGIYDKLAHTTARHKQGMRLMEAVAPFTVAGRQLEELPLNKPRIYALSSGMMTGNTLSNAFARRMLSDPTQSLFFVGYADPESAAGKILAAKPGDMVTVDLAHPPQRLDCTVRQFNFSAHADRETLRAYVRKVQPKTVVLVHGDVPAVRWFQESLAADLPGTRVISPDPGVPVEL